MNKTEKIHLELKNTFSENQTISREDMFKFLSKFYTDLKKSTFLWRIYELKKSNVISSIKKDLFKITTKQNSYSPIIDKSLLKIYKFIDKEFLDISVCVWNSNWLNDFSRHQAFKNTVLVEVEKDLVQSVFNRLSDNHYKDVFFEPDSNNSKTYLSESKNPIIVRPLITKAPIQKNQNMYIPKIEKILVDVFCDKHILTGYQGYELITIFENALSQYEINYTTLLHYSLRRKREKHLKEFLLKNIEITKEFL